MKPDQIFHVGKAFAFAPRNGQALCAGEGGRHDGGIGGERMRMVPVEFVEATGFGVTPSERCRGCCRSEASAGGL